VAFSRLLKLERPRVPPAQVELLAQVAVPVGGAAREGCVVTRRISGSDGKHRHHRARAGARRATQAHAHPRDDRLARRPRRRALRRRHQRGGCAARLAAARLAALAPAGRARCAVDDGGGLGSASGGGSGGDGSGDGAVRGGEPHHRGRVGLAGHLQEGSGPAEGKGPGRAREGPGKCPRRLGCDEREVVLRRAADRLASVVDYDV